MQIHTKRRTAGAVLLTVLCSASLAAQDVLVQASRIIVAHGDGNAPAASHPTSMNDSNGSDCRSCTVRALVISNRAGRP